MQIGPTALVFGIESFKGEKQGSRICAAAGKADWRGWLAVILAECLDIAENAPNFPEKDFHLSESSMK